MHLLIASPHNVLCSLALSGSITVKKLSLQRDFVAPCTVSFELCRETALQSNILRIYMEHLVILLCCIFLVVGDEHKVHALEHGWLWPDTAEISQHTGQRPQTTLYAHRSKCSLCVCDR